MDDLKGIAAIKAHMKVGRKYTMLTFTEKGYLEQRCFVLENISFRPYHDLPNPCLLIIKGNKDILKWDKFIRLHAQKQFVLWEGYHKINTSLEVSRSLLPGGSISLKRWPAEDPRYLLRAIEDVNVDPIAGIIDSVKPEVLLNYQCISEQQ